MDQTSDLSSLTEVELQNRICKLHQELDKRKAPQPIMRMESLVAYGVSSVFVKVYDMCVKHVKALNGECSDTKDLEHYMYESSMEAVYGSSIWEWVRNKC